MTFTLNPAIERQTGPASSRIDGASASIGVVSILQWLYIRKAQAMSEENVVKEMIKRPSLPTRLKLTALFLAITCTVLPLPGWAGEHSPNEAEQATNWTDILISTTGVLRPFRGSDGQWNLVYEAELSNFTTDAVILDSLEVLDARNKERVLLNLRGKALEDVVISLTSYKNKNEKHTKIGPGGLAVAFININSKEKAAFPGEVIHRIQYHALTGKEANKTITIMSATRPVDEQEAVVIGPPLQGGRWVAEGGYCGKLGHRRALFPIDNHLVSSQRYAIDWERIDDDNYSTKGDFNKVESSRCYNEPVYAVADGKVVAVVSHFADQPPGVPSGNRLFPGGNYIVLEIGKNICAFYAHLKPGSILVKDGDIVKKGQHIANLGNSGNSTAAHLHMHIMNGAKPLGSSGIPYVFDKFELVGEVADMEKFDEDDAKSRKQTIKPVAQAWLHHHELIKEGHVVRFSIDPVENRPEKANAQHN